MSRRYPSVGGGGGPSSRPSAPRGYVAGLGRGASGFTTRSDVGPAVKPSSADADADPSGPPSDPHAAADPSAGSFGAAPKNYVAGMGRGMGGRKTDGADEGAQATGAGGYDSFAGYGGKMFADTPYDDEDEEADLIYGAVDERMVDRGRKKRGRGRRNNPVDESAEGDAGRSIGDNFRDLKEKLAGVSADEWAALPGVGDHSLKHKQRRRQETFTPLPDGVVDMHAGRCWG
mmetsp:Transcript_24265/g.48269  ORF Transcript_24265/g.48269 Transcript_24265/m.48269 type:complete len:231 (+) Transcript_24265:31-723(+)